MLSDILKTLSKVFKEVIGVPEPAPTRTGWVLVPFYDQSWRDQNLQVVPDSKVPMEYRIQHFGNEKYGKKIPDGSYGFWAKKVDGDEITRNLPASQWVVNSHDEVITINKYYKKVFN